MESLRETDPDRYREIVERREQACAARQCRELSPLLLKARERELVGLGKSLGYTDADAVVFAEYISNVFENTSLMGGLMSGGPGRGRRTGPPVSRPAAQTPNATVR